MTTPQGSAFPSHYVGIGASAGGLEAIETFFTHMPPESGLAFIVVQHLSPDYKSLMVELLSKRTQMTVLRAEDGMTVETDRVYLIPPKKNLTIFHGKLLLSEQDHSRGINLPIDVFFRSLAEDQGEKSVGVVLSGTGSDGMRGVRAIKEFGGMVMVQDEESAKFDGMPRSAISTGLADFILPPAEMPDQLLSYARHPYVSKSERSETLLSDEDGLTRIFSILRERCKVDFTFYKPSTVTRRIERRMTINQVSDIRDYVAYLKNYPGEVAALYRELLIGVTSFFRDENVFHHLTETCLPELFQRRSNQEMRFWVAGCSTGEEAYTLAMISRECMENMGISHDVKIFATDIDRDAVLMAGNGVYPESIAADLSPRLLGKYFYRKEDNFQIARNIREMVVFAQHNLIKDPPFTNIDLVSCRNLLIYLQPVLQKKVLDLFNFSLNPQGILLLGTSETTGDMGDFFSCVHQRHKIYQAKGKARLPGDDQSLMAYGDTQSVRDRSHFAAVRKPSRDNDNERLLERLLGAASGDYLPLTVVVNEQMEVLHVLGDTAGYFKLPSGRLRNDISKMAAKELAIPLSTGIQKAFRNRQELRYSNIPFQHGAASVNVHMRIKPLPEKRGQEPLVAVFLEEVQREKTSRAEGEALSYDINKEAEQHIRDLEQELQFNRENLQATIEELETANEELQATNEELLASNEELQSTNEELQSTNEELHTVNAEYQKKIIELTELNNDVENLLTSSRIGKLFLDENLEVRKFSPQIARVFKLLENDVGRPITHLSHYLANVNPLDAIAKVQESNKPVEEEVRAQDGGWYLMRVLPYHIGPREYSGVVLTFVDISQIKKAEEDLRRSEERYRTLFETMTQGVVYQDAKGEIFSANPAAEAILGLSIDQMRGRRSTDGRWKTVHPDGMDFPGEAHPSMRALRTGLPVKDVVMGVFNPVSDETRWINVHAIPQFRRGEKRPYQVYTTFEDVTARLHAERALQEALKENCGHEPGK